MLASRYHIYPFLLALLLLFALAGATGTFACLMSWINLLEVYDKGAVLLLLRWFWVFFNAFCSFFTSELGRLGWCLAVIFFQSVLSDEILFLVTSLAVYPKALIDKFLLEEELSLSASLVFEESAFVEIAICPIIHSEAVFFIKHIMSFVILCTWLRVCPNTVSVAIALFEVSSIEADISPSILSESLW